MSSLYAELGDQANISEEDVGKQILYFNQENYMNMSMRSSGAELNVETFEYLRIINNNF